MHLSARALPLFGALMSLALCFGGARVAAAQTLEPGAIPPPEPSSPIIVPPKKKQDPGVRYPKQALDDKFFETVSVALVLDISATGAVTEAKVVTPIGHGFDEAAATAARSITFEPALRNGAPVAAKIKFTYQFVPPAPRLTGRVTKQSTDSPVAGAKVRVLLPDGSVADTTTDADGGWSLAVRTAGKVHVDVAADGFAPSAIDDSLAFAEETRLLVRLERPVEAPPPAPVDAGGERVEEVFVRGVRPPREVVKRTLEQDEIAFIPGTNGDALRSIQNLPGVARPAPFSGALVVRGSAPEDTPLLVNGTNVPIMYHFGGLSSVIPTELVKQIDFYPGNFSAQYGRGMGGVVDVGLRDPKHDGLHGLAQVDLIDARVLAEGPIWGGWNFLVAGRRSWIDVWLSPVLNKLNAGVTEAPRYYDWQAELQKDFNSHSGFRVFFFGSNDGFNLLRASPSQSQPTFAGDLNFSQSFWRVQAQYENKISSATRLLVTAAAGRDAIDFGIGSDYFHLIDTQLSMRAELSQKIAPELIANVGIDVLDTPYTASVRFPPFPKPGQPSAGPNQPPLYSSSTGFVYTPGAYAEFEYTPFSTTRIVPGLRVDNDSVTSKWDVSPRLTVRQVVKSGFPSTTINAGAGVFYQPPQPQETDPIFGMPGLHSNRAIHYDLGFEQEFTHQIVLANDVFYKSFEDLVELSSNPAVPGGNVGSGFAYGVEWLLKYKPDQNFFGWISYTLSRSERREFPGQPMSLFVDDQTHVFTILGSYLFPNELKVGKGHLRLGGWRIGGRFRVVTGGLYTPTTEGAFDATAGSQGGVAAVPPYGSRLPPFVQLDVRIDKTWKFRRWNLTLYLDVQNVTNRQNPEGVVYSYNYTQSANVNGLPIIPDLGIRGDF